MGSEALRAACELAFTVARQDAEAQTFEPPPGMRSFLFVAELPRRAISAAQQAVEDDSDFRSRVASRADENETGRAGFLWLTRPAGWAREFEQLTSIPMFGDGVDKMGDDGETSSEMDLGGGFEKAVALNAEEAHFIPAYTNSPAEPAAASATAAQSERSEPEHTFDPGDTFSSQHQPLAEAPLSLLETDDGLEATSNQPPPPAQFEVASRGIAVTDQANIESNDQTFASFGEVDPTLEHSSALDLESDAIENELSSLRGLVSRLASERDMVASNLPLMADEPEALGSSGRDLEGEILDLTNDLEAARHELSIIGDDLLAARQEREEAQRQNSATLQRQVELESELANIRDQRVEMEDRASTTQVSVINLEERLARSESQYEEVERERSVTKSQVETMSAELAQIREDRAGIRAERDELRVRIAEVEEKAGGQDVGNLRAIAETASVELEATKSELEATKAQADDLRDQIQGTSATADSLAAEKVDLSSRLADTQLALETTTTQHEALRIDSERLAAEVGTLRADRDGLQAQLTDLQASLADVLHQQSEIRQRNDADRKALNQLRVERDVQLARMADLEKAAQQGEAKVVELISERDDLVRTQQALIEERGQLRGEAAAAAKDKEQFVDKLEQGEIVRGLLEQELEAERSRHEQMEGRISELDALAEKNKLEMAQLADDRQTLLSGVEELEADRARWEGIAAERDALTAQLAEQESEWNQQNTVQSEQVQTLTEKLAQSDEIREKLEAEVKDLADRRAAETEVRAKLEQQLGGMLEQQASFEATRSGIDQELADERVARSDLGQQLADLQSIRAGLDQELIDLRVAQADLEQELVQERATRSEIEQNLTGLESNRALVDEELSSHREAREKLNVELAELRLTRDDNEEKLANSQNLQNDLEQELLSLRLAKEELEQQLTLAKETQTGVDLERHELEDQLALGTSAREALEARLQASDSARVELEKQLAEAVADVDALRVDLESTNRELEEAQSSALEQPAQTVGMPVTSFKRDTAGEVQSEADENLVGIDAADTDSGEIDIADTDSVEIDPGEKPATVDPPAEDFTAENLDSVDLDLDLDAGAESVEADQPDDVAITEVAGNPTSTSPNLEDTVDIDLVDLPLVVDGEPPLAASPANNVDFNWPPPATVEDLSQSPPEVEAEPLASGQSVIDFDEEDDDLDEVSALIAQTVTSFDGDDDLVPEADPEVEDLNEAEGRSALPSLAPPSIFGPRDDDVADRELPEKALSPLGRRQIEIPQDIHEDELAVARYVVASADVVLLVDGDSVAKLGWPSLPVPKQRDALVTYLAELSASTGAAPDVVFDGRIGDDGSLPASRLVRIRLSTPPTEPAAALDELVDAYPEQWPIALVTDDRSLADSAEGRGATVLSNGQLLDLFIGE